MHTQINLTATVLAGLGELTKGPSKLKRRLKLLASNKVLPQILVGLTSCSYTNIYNLVVILSILQC